MRSLRIRLLVALVTLPLLVAIALTYNAVSLYQRDKVLYVSDLSAQTVDLLARNIEARLRGLVAQARLGAKVAPPILALRREPAPAGTASAKTTVHNVSSASDARLRIVHSEPGARLVLKVQPRALLDLSGHSGAAEIAIVDARGELLVHVDGGNVRKRRKVPQLLERLQLSSANAPRIGTRQLDWGGGRRLVSFARAPAGITVLQSYSLAQVRAAASPLIKSAILISAITMALAILVALVVGGRISAPLKAMAEQVEAIGRGELGKRVETNATGAIGVLVDRLNALGAALEQRERELSRTQRQLLHSERLNATSRLINSIVSELSEPLDRCVSLASSAYSTLDEGHQARALQKEIIEQANRVSNMLQNLRRAAAPDESPARVIEADLALADTVISAGPMLERRGLTLDSDVGEDMTVFVRADQLNNALLDILLFVAERADPGSKISLVANKLEVPADEGDGAPAVALTSIRIFYRGEAPPASGSEQSAASVTAAGLRRRRPSAGLLAAAGDAKALPLAVATLVLRDEGGDLSGVAGDPHSFEILLPAAERSASR
ncbi:MAG: hypothetical protein KC503_15920 [Myxococcales bacterium]|nr:hypothetical protein [Myxococcales bacterium]